jgi:hypothetical protein
MNQLLGLLRSLAIAATVAGHSSSALAAEQFHSGTLKWVYPLASGDFVIGFDADTATCPSTNSPKYMHVVVGQNGVTSDGAKKIYAAAMPALGASKQVVIAFDDATAQLLHQSAEGLELKRFRPEENL